MKTSGKYKFAKQKTFLATYCLLLATVAAALPLAIQAEPSTTDNYRLDPNVSNSFGGLTDSDSYQLLDSGGEAAVGLGDSPSYKLSQGYVSQLEQAIELNVLPDGLVGYWPLNTGTGIQAYDVTPNNNRGELRNDPAWVDGKVGEKALEFDGQDDVVSAPHDSSLSISDSVTIGTWIYPTASGQSSRSAIAGKIYVNCCAYEYGLRLNSDNTISFDTKGIDNGNLYGNSNTSVNLNEWTHILATYDGTEKRIYINGELDATYAASGELATSSQSFSMGAFDDTYDTNGQENRRFEGYIDEVKVHDYAFSEDEATDEYRASEAGIPSALTLPKLDSTSSQTVAADAIVRTDAGGYHLAIEQDGDLRTEDGETIPPINGSISAPNLWNEGDTIGFGFTVTDAVQRDGKWGSDPDFEYAAVPGSSTTFHARDGLSGGTKEITSLQFRTGIDTTQSGGIYRNRLGFTATLKP